jgi:spermidine synthase
MTRPWQTIARAATPEGPLELRQRGDRDFLITIDGRVLMTSQARRSEQALATLSLRERPPAKLSSVVIGGLGMGYTLRAALDLLPAGTRVTVVELNADVVSWCRGPLAPLTDNAVADPRVTVVLADVADFIAGSAPAAHDAILLDLYEGPHAATQRRNDPLYGPAALARTHAALAAGGVFAVWSEEPDRAFEQRLVQTGFAVHKKRSGGGGRAHLVYLGYT